MNGPLKSSWASSDPFEKLESFVERHLRVFHSLAVLYFFVIINGGGGLRKVCREKGGGTGPRFPQDFHRLDKRKKRV